ncbi:oligosaccharide flippase family protein [Natrarchaeobaculum sulfurireducens]|uniref:Polysaccharide biosynthesis protein n=1 Tax=Natrarchaeobaculum sulfurireducens TaxID=2044521 RepID=A0A346P9R8_9EURY|nr:oligosaccharide flippase family protein [Natrarchaeobaculum sulfurireducens]AXR76263.1 polysaccharide biosynthesis protein [Natrarchaeobaculum sulfurireducens]
MCVRPKTFAMTDAGGESRIQALVSIARGASLYTVGKVVSDAGEFVLHLLVSRYLGAGLYGLFAYGKTLAFTALLLTNLGSDTSILKYLPQYEDQPKKRRFLLGLAWVTSFLGALVVSVALFVFAPTIAALTLDEAGFVAVLRLFAGILFLDTLANLLYATFRAVELIEYEVLTGRILKPILRVVGVGGALLAGASVYGVVVAMVVASAVTLIVAIAFFFRRLEIRPTLHGPHATRGTVTEYYNFSLPLTAKEAGTVMQGRIDVLIVGVFLSSTAVGIYNVSVLVSSLLYIPILAFNQLFPPIAARLYANDERADLAAIYGATTRWIFTISLLLGLIVVVFRTEILMVFGSEFTAGTLVLTLFVVSQLFNCATGPSDSLLMMTDHQYTVMANEWVFGIANVVLNIVLIQQYGFVGAAVASAGVLAVRNLTKVAEVWYFERLHPYSRSFFKPLFAGVIAAVGMLVVSALLPPLPAVVLGAVVGIVLYAGVLFLFGIESVDRQAYEKIVGARKSAE